MNGGNNHLIFLTYHPCINPTSAASSLNPRKLKKIISRIIENISTAIAIEKIYDFSKFSIGQKLFIGVLTFKIDFLVRLFSTFTLSNSQMG